MSNQQELVKAARERALMIRREHQMRQQRKERKQVPATVTVLARRSA